MGTARVVSRFRGAFKCKYKFSLRTRESHIESHGVANNESYVLLILKRPILLLL